MQEKRKSIAKALELRLSCTSIYVHEFEKTLKSSILPGKMRHEDA